VKPFVVFNPKKRPVEELTVIYGYVTEARRGVLTAAMVASDGYGFLFSASSDEEFELPAMLGMVEGARPQRIRLFEQMWSDGFRMEWVPSAQVATHGGLRAALAKQRERNPARG
jgi:hypothetical protein